MSKYKFGKTSNKRLDTCHPDLIRLFDYAILHEDCPCDFSILCGYRSQEEQEEAYRKGLSKAHFGQSPHNYEPSFAVDVAPYVSGKGIPWEKGDHDFILWSVLSRHILKCAQELQVDIRWGNDWDMDGIPVELDPDEKFADLPHWEINGWKKMI